MSSPRPDSCEPKDLIGTDGLLGFDMTALIVQMSTVRSGEVVRDCKFQGMVGEMPLVYTGVVLVLQQQWNQTYFVTNSCVSTATGPLHIGSTFKYLLLSISISFCPCSYYFGEEAY